MPYLVLACKVLRYCRQGKKANHCTCNATLNTQCRCCSSTRQYGVTAQSSRSLSKPDFNALQVRLMLVALDSKPTQIFLFPIPQIIAQMFHALRGKQLNKRPVCMLRGKQINKRPVCMLRGKQINKRPVCTPRPSEFDECL